MSFQMDLKIKQVKKVDVDNFAEKEWSIINEKYGLLPSKETFFFGAYSNNKLAGYARVELRGGVTEIRDILVKDELTGDGIGSELVNYIEKWAVKNKCKKVVLKAPSVFGKTIKFYKNKGYKKDATLPKYYYGHNWYYMSKKL